MILDATIAPSPGSVDPALERFRASRSEDDLRTIMVEHVEALRAICRGVLHRHDLVEDAVQETFVQLVHHAETISGPAGPWLRRTSLNTALNHLRSEAARRRRERSFAEESASALAATGGSRLDAEARRLVGEGISHLDEPLRSTVARVYFFGRSQQEVATEDGISQVAVHKRIKRALSALRMELMRTGIADAVHVAVNGVSASSGHASILPEPACVLVYALWKLPELLRVATLAASRVGVAGAAMVGSGIDCRGYQPAFRNVPSAGAPP